MKIPDLLDAIRNGEEKLVDGILSARPEWINQKDERGSTPLLLATYYGNMQITQRILNQNADINAQDAAGNTALMGVCFKHYNDIARLLINQGADINLTNNNGANALTYCATFNNQEIATLLLQKGIDAQQKDIDGLTPAHHARAQGLLSFADFIDTFQQDE